MKDAEKDYYQQQGALLRDIRKQTGKTRQDVADFFGVGYQYVSMVERGERTLSSYDLQAWGRFLGVVLVVEDGAIKGYKKAGV